MLLGAGMINVGLAQEEITETKLRVEPKLVSAYPGDVFSIDITIELVEDLYAFEFKLGFEPGGRILAVDSVQEGGFLKSGGDTFFVWKTYAIDGYVLVGGTLLYDVPGVSGSGVLATINFYVVEAGECPLTLFDTVLIDSNLNEIVHQTRDGYYEGPTANLVRLRLYKRDMHVGETQTFAVKVENEADVPLYVRARLDNIRREDGAVFTFYAGQQFTTAPPRPDELLYVNENTSDYTDWETVGVQPYLNAIEDGNYIYETEHCSLIGVFRFENISLDGAMIKDVWLEGYTRYPGGPDSDMDMDVYGRIPGVTGWTWLGSLWGTAEWQWVRPRWLDPWESVSYLIPETKTEEGLNSLEIVVHYWTVDGESHGVMELDAVRLVVEFYPPITPLEPPYFVIPPYEAVELDLATWVLRSEDKGTYMTTVTVEFRYYEPWPLGWWIKAERSMTRTWWVTEPVT